MFPRKRPFTHSVAEDTDLAGERFSLLLPQIVAHVSSSKSIIGYYSTLYH